LPPPSAVAIALLVYTTKKETQPLLALWDESQWWGLLLDHAIRSLSLPVEWVRSRDIAGRLLGSPSPGALLVPGGWSKLKSQSLGTKGCQAIQEYVRTGGTYIGFCGGAALALSTGGAHPGLGLCPWGRKSFSNRLPNFSGHIRSRLIGDGAFLRPDQPADVLLPVWWPSQFSPAPGPPVKTLASYMSPGQDFWVSDLKVSSLPEEQIPLWERCYRIKLRPETISGEPCIISGEYGRGKYLLSYAHLETPASNGANALLLDIVQRVSGAEPISPGPVPPWPLLDPAAQWENDILRQSHALLLDLFEVGASNFLLFWRSSWLMGWRRGIPGPALNTLLAYIVEALRRKPDHIATAYWREHGPRFLDLLKLFHREMTVYLLAERLARADSPVPVVDADLSSSLQEVKRRLVGTFPGYGGPYGTLVDLLDGLLWTLIASSR
jgi:hypothetical protein